MDIGILKNWLGEFPGWEGVPQVDTTGAVPVSAGFFPRGTEEISRTEDVLGNVRLRVRDTFLLVRHCAGNPEENALWMQDLQRWIRQQDLANRVPLFGFDQVTRAEKGRLEKNRSGTAEYTEELTVEYTTLFPNTDLLV